MRTDEHVPVLIVGAGGAGLSLALLLLQQGVRSTVIERRSQISWYPRARNLNFRTMEIFRGLGLADEIHDVGTRVSRIFRREYLASADQTEVLDPASLLDTRVLSPEPFLWYCPQSRLEPVLLATARQRGASVSYSTELDDLSANDDGITATLHDHADSSTSRVHADYLVGADGAHSRVREILGVSTWGHGTIDEHDTFIYVRAAWDALIKGYESDAFLISNPQVRTMFVLAENDLGMFVFTHGPEENGVEFTRERGEELVAAAIGDPELPVELVEISPWRPEERVAERFQQGHVFLVGDAAHTMPPKEGLGVNTGIQSAQNLAWKLAAVLHGRATPALLATYEVERQPVARFAAEHSLTGPAAALLEGTPPPEKSSEFFPIIGYRYQSDAVIPEGNTSATRHEVAVLSREELSGEPGTRMPHLWVEQGGKRISTLDLLDGSFVLLTGAEGTAWRDAAATLRGPSGVPLACYRVGPDAELRDLEGAWLEKAGIPADGAVLVRPDGFVAWRARDGGAGTQSHEARLEEVLAQILGHPAARAV